MHNGRLVKNLKMIWRKFLQMGGKLWNYHTVHNVRVLLSRFFAEISWKQRI